ncbi:MAG: nucleoside kinase [Clostridia bacterium]|nr:nucleoside kinase [Clostridia bacterium]
MTEINISDINALVESDPMGLIAKSEDAYHALIDEAASRISADKNLRILLLAGPSGSGKTTTANLICDRIKSHGEGCIVVSLDDFYRSFDDTGYPKLADGTNDCESPLALDIPLLSDTLSAIAESRAFLLPKYDFKTSRRSEMRLHEPMADGCVIIEGLHALNPLVFSEIPHSSALKLFISVSTNVNKDGRRILSGRKIRFIRRMVRDSIYRNATAERTLSMWKNVLIGEDEYLYPNRKYADISFDTFHAFELSVMRPFAQNLISTALAEGDEYARVVLDALAQALPLGESVIPESSLIREFIPGGKYEALY